MFGEYNFWVMEYAWQVSTIKKTSLYLRRIAKIDWYMQEDLLTKTKKLIIACEKLICSLIWSKSSSYRLFCHICSKASASSTLVISSASWNLRNPSPPCPGNKTTFIASAIADLLQSRQQGLYWRQHRSVRNVNHLVRLLPTGILLINSLCSTWNICLFIYSVSNKYNGAKYIWHF